VGGGSRARNNPAPSKNEVEEEGDEVGNVESDGSEPRVRLGVMDF